MVIKKIEMDKKNLGEALYDVNCLLTPAMSTISLKGKLNNEIRLFLAPICCLCYEEQFAKFLRLLRALCRLFRPPLLLYASMSWFDSAPFQIWIYKVDMHLIGCIKLCKFVWILPVQCARWDSAHKRATSDFCTQNLEKIEKRNSYGALNESSPLFADFLLQ